MEHSDRENTISKMHIPEKINDIYFIAYKMFIHYNTCLFLWAKLYYQNLHSICCNCFNYTGSVVLLQKCYQDLSCPRTLQPPWNKNDGSKLWIHIISYVNPKNVLTCRSQVDSPTQFTALLHQDFECQEKGQVLCADL